MNRKLRSYSALGLLAAVLAGCGKDSTGPQALDQVVAMEIFGELISQVFLVGFGAVGAPPAAVSGAADVVSADTFSETAPCERGGTVTMVGNYTNAVSQQGTGTIAFDLRSTPSGCRVDTSHGLFTVNGDPDLRIAFNMNVVNWAPVGIVTMTWNGGYSWNGPGGTGSCSMDLTYTYNFDNPAQNSLRGHMCGYSFS